MKIKNLTSGLISYLKVKLWQMVNEVINILN